MRGGVLFLLLLLRNLEWCLLSLSLLSFSSKPTLAQDSFPIDLNSIFGSEELGALHSFFLMKGENLGSPGEEQWGEPGERSGGH